MYFIKSTISSQHAKIQYVETQQLLNNVLSVLPAKEYKINGEKLNLLLVFSIVKLQFSLEIEAKMEKTLKLKYNFFSLEVAVIFSALLFLNYLVSIIYGSIFLFVGTTILIFAALFVILGFNTHIRNKLYQMPFIVDKENDHLPYNYLLGQKNSVVDTTASEEVSVNYSYLTNRKSITK